MSATAAVEATEGHNAAARKQIIKEVCADLDQIDSEIRELQEKRSGIKAKRIKGDLGMKMRDFNTLRTIYGLEGDARDELFSTLQEGFDALGISWPA